MFTTITDPTPEQLTLPTGFKECSSCHQLKPITDFNKKSNSKDGHQYYCRDCSAAKNRQHRDVATATAASTAEQTPAQRAEARIVAALSNYTDCQLRDELQRRGYRGYLSRKPGLKL
jgi:hypothetical protein